MTLTDRSFDPAQLERLHRIVALRQLGFGLEDVASILAVGRHCTPKLLPAASRRRVRAGRFTFARIPRTSMSG
ncbi:MerR family transcriptional regulator [Arthrobacter sp. zg-Y1143]|uniref:MerR family transcriptional regulator n=1 Tax=Arthrobacter sp. zg-Y1143 TaxID=3049065 RepID=UPI0024C2873C|nr:MerR family transcriptional regulator [Arthrobacter sp. zg-Y1143]MDK1326435.1 hypothetical protein [Arthrobacter sp. zg-Y1143]